MPGFAAAPGFSHAPATPKIRQGLTEATRVLSRPGGVASGDLAESASDWPAAAVRRQALREVDAVFRPGFGAVPSRVERQRP